jgi:hypothetical protein
MFIRATWGNGRGGEGEVEFTLNQLAMKNNNQRDQDNHTKHAK